MGMVVDSPDGHVNNEITAGVGKYAVNKGEY